MGRQDERSASCFPHPADLIQKRTVRRQDIDPVRIQHQRFFVFRQDQPDQLLRLPGTSQSAACGDHIRPALRVPKGVGRRPILPGPVLAGRFAVQGKHGLRRRRLQDAPVFFSADHPHHARSRPKYGAGRKHCRSRHARTPCRQQDLSEGSLVPVRIPLREKHRHILTKSKSSRKLSQKAFLRDPDLRQPDSPRIRSAGIKQKATLQEGKSDRHIRPYRTAVNRSRIRPDAGWDIHAQHKGPASVHMRHSLRADPFKGPFQTDTEHGIHDHVILLFRRMIQDRTAVSFQDLQLFFGFGRTSAPLSDEPEIHRKALLHQKPAHSQPVSAVVSASRRDQRPFSPKSFFRQDLPGAGERGPLHQHQRRNAEAFRGIPVAGFHLRSRDQIFHLFFFHLFFSHLFVPL